MKQFKRILAIILMATLLIASVTVPSYAEGRKSKAVKTTRVVLSRTGTITLTVGQTLRLSATVKPANSTQKVKWSTSKKSVATVKNGKVTAKRPAGDHHRQVRQEEGQGEDQGRQGRPGPDRDAPHP